MFAKTGQEMPRFRRPWVFCSKGPFFMISQDSYLIIWLASEENEKK